MAGKLTPRDLNEWVTLDDLADVHEALAWEGALNERAGEKG